MSIEKVSNLEKVGNLRVAMGSSFQKVVNPLYLLLGITSGISLPAWPSVAPLENVAKAINQLLVFRPLKQTAIMCLLPATRFLIFTVPGLQPVVKQVAIIPFVLLVISDLNPSTFSEKVSNLEKVGNLILVMGSQPSKRLSTLCRSKADGHGKK